MIAAEQSVVMSVGDVAGHFGRSRNWARALLRGWLDEQEHGGEMRVIVRRDARGRPCLYTTRTVLLRSTPPARDARLVRQVAQLERDVTQLARRLDAAITEIAALRREAAMSTRVDLRRRSG